MSRHAPIDANAARVWNLLPRPRRARLLWDWREVDRCPYCGHRMRGIVARFEGKRSRPALACRQCSRPDVDYRTRDRDGAAVCVAVELRVPGVGRAELDIATETTPQPIESGARLAPGWLPFVEHVVAHAEVDTYHNWDCR